MSDQVILWRRLDQPGLESARLSFRQSQWHLLGTAVFPHKQQPCRLDYSILCNSQWQTLSAKVGGWIGKELVEIDLAVDPAHRWRMNGAEVPAVEGCIDLDLNFSPCTNLLPIRRLSLNVGQEAEVQAAWLRFPSFALESLQQIYRRTDATSYRYESAGGKFVADLQVNAAGFVTRYADFWTVEGES